MAGNAMYVPLKINKQPSFTNTWKMRSLLSCHQQVAKQATFLPSTSEKYAAFFPVINRWQSRLLSCHQLVVKQTYFLPSSRGMWHVTWYMTPQSGEMLLFIFLRYFVSFPRLESWEFNLRLLLLLLLTCSVRDGIRNAHYTTWRSTSRGHSHQNCILISAIWRLYVFLVHSLPRLARASDLRLSICQNH